MVGKWQENFLMGRMTDYSLQYCFVILFFSHLDVLRWELSSACPFQAIDNLSTSHTLIALGMELSESYISYTTF